MSYRDYSYDKKDPQAVLLDPPEQYHGQRYFHKNNRAIARAENRWSRLAFEARVRRMLGRLGILALVVIVTFALFVLCFPNDWLRP